MVRDVGDGWAAWTARRARMRPGRFAYVSQLHPPATGDWVQGDVARVGAKVLGEDDGLTDPRPRVLGRPPADRVGRGRRARRGAAVTGLFRRRTFLRARDLAPRYDVVIVGGGVNGLSLAHNLAAHHGITTWRCWSAPISASGGSGRNTQVVRANYNTPENVPLYKASLGIWRDAVGRARLQPAVLDPGRARPLPHDGLARGRAGQVAAEPRLRRPDRRPHGRGDRAAQPARRSHRRRRAAGARRLLPPAGLVRPPRRRRVGLRGVGDPARRPRARTDGGHRHRRRDGVVPRRA